MKQKSLLLFILVMMLLLAMPAMAQGQADYNNSRSRGKKEKITICHLPGGDSSKGREITISKNGLNGHQKSHGKGDEDIIGPCPSKPPKPDPCPDNMFGKTGGHGSGDCPPEPCPDYFLSKTGNHKPDKCPPPPPPPPVSVCPNLEGHYDEVPDGYELVDGKCVKIPDPPVSVCPNLPGHHDTVPDGYELVNGECIKIPDPPRVIRGCTDENADNHDPKATEDDGSCRYTDPPDPPVEKPEEDKKPATLTGFELDCEPSSGVVGSKVYISATGFLSDGGKQELVKGLRMRVVSGNGQVICAGTSDGCYVTSAVLGTVIVEVQVLGLEMVREVTVVFTPEPSRPYTEVFGVYPSQSQIDCKEWKTVCANVPRSYEKGSWLDVEVIDPNKKKDSYRINLTSPPVQGEGLRLVSDEVDTCTISGRYEVLAYLRDAVGNNLISGTGNFFVKKNPNSPIIKRVEIQEFSDSNQLLMEVGGELADLVSAGVFQKGDEVHIALVSPKMFLPLKAVLMEANFENRQYHNLVVGPGLKQGYPISLPSEYYTLLVYVPDANGGAAKVLNQPEAISVPSGPDGDGRLELN